MSDLVGESVTVASDYFNDGKCPGKCDLVKSHCCRNSGNPGEVGCRSHVYKHKALAAEVQGEG
jgi:hypothetical protein